MLKYAVVGTSWITEEFILGANLVEGMALAAVYSRSAEKGENFAKRVGAPKVYTDLFALACSDIDAVYIASPNNLHFEQSKLFLKNNKNVICEKPITVTPAELEELQALAKNRGLVYMEAIMFMHSPAKKILQETLKKIGKISSAHFDFSQLSSRYALLKNGEHPNIFNPKMAGGCLMDLGCYCVYPAIYFFGEPLKISASAGFLLSGADGCGSAIFEYSDKQVTLTYSKTAQDRAGSQVMGDEGTVVIESISKLTDILLYNNTDNKKDQLVGNTPKYIIMGYEAQAFYNFVTAFKENQTDYAKASETALMVSRALSKIRELSAIKLG
ncbi:MAG: Gfo/Idh/MocA family oxidoreductase [Eubacteriales bacterium]